MAAMWRLSGAWYGNRLAPQYRQKSPEEYQAMLRAADLTGPFWQLA